MFDIKDAIYVASILGVSFDKFSIDDFLRGINIELEHLNEHPDYYNKDYGLLAFEEFLKRRRENKRIF